MIIGPSLQESAELKFQLNDHQLQAGGFKPQAYKTAKACPGTIKNYEANAS